MTRSFNRLTLAGKILFTVIPILVVLTIYVLACERRDLTQKRVEGRQYHRTGKMA